MEIWDIYNKDRQKTGKYHERGNKMNEGDYHLVVHVWIVNDQGQILIQKRQPWKLGYPNMWDCSAAGSAIKGDNSIDAAVRETKEELGIDLDLNKAKMLFTHTFSRGFDDIWLVRQNFNINDLSLQYEEVADAKWVSKLEIMRIIENGTFIKFDYIDKIFEII